MGPGSGRCSSPGCVLSIPVCSELGAVAGGELVHVACHIQSGASGGLCPDSTPLTVQALVVLLNQMAHM